MITAKNYVAQAIKSMSQAVIPLAASADMKKDADALKGMIDEFAHAVHFALPDNALIFDDSLRGLRGASVRLPFQTITIEYFAEDNPTQRNAELKIARKRLVYAFEASAEQIGPELQLAYPEADAWIFVYGFYANEAGVWSPCLCSWAMPSTWDCVENTSPVAEPLIPSKESIKMIGYPVPFMGQMFDQAVKAYGTDKAITYVTHDISGEVRAVLELCEALSCSNVSHEPIEKVNPAVNARRVRDGKMPLYETRRLVINAGQPTASGQGAGGTHASPRQHLRRGHIRRLPTSNIWVNSCVVGSAENGILHKDYAVKNGRAA